MWNSFFISMFWSLKLDLIYSLQAYWNAEVVSAKKYLFLLIFQLLFENIERCLGTFEEQLMKGYLVTQLAFVEVIMRQFGKYNDTFD